MKKGWLAAIIAVVLWFIVFGAAYTGFYVGLGVERADALRNFGVVNQGIVAAKRPDQHRSIIYYFKVDGIQYTGIGGGGFGNPDFDQLSVGDSVGVRYDPGNP